MKRLTALAWKEWHESRWLVAAGLAVFLGLPLIGAWQSRLAGYPRFEPLASPLVFALGGVTAALLGVAAAGRDLAGRLEDFWRSRPISTGRWLTVKYLVGLAAVLLVCGLPLVVEIVADQRRQGVGTSALSILAWAPFLWAALYSLGFAAACLVRRPAHAASLAAAGLVLVYFAPLVLPPLRPVSVEWVGEHAWQGGDPRSQPGWPWPRLSPAQVPFVVAMAGLSVALFVVAVGAVGRGWEVRSGPKLMYGAVGTVLLVLFASAAYQLGSNLPVLQTMALEPGERSIVVRSDGARGVVCTGRHWWRIDTVRAVTVTPTGATLGPPVRLPGPWEFVVARQAAESSARWRPDQPGVVYLVGKAADGERARLDLVAVSLDPAAGNPVVGQLTLWEQQSSQPYEPARPALFLWGDRLHVLTDHHRAEVDIADPRNLKRVEAAPRPVPPGANFASDYKSVFPLRWDLDLPARQQLVLGLRPSRYTHPDKDLDGDVLCRWDGEALVTSRLVNLTAAAATFEEVGRFETPFLLRFFGSSHYAVQAAGGRAYLSNQRYGSDERPRLLVLDVRDPARPSTAGHFAVPGSAPLVPCPLPDGRVLIGGQDKVYLVGPPPER